MNGLVNKIKKIDKNTKELINKRLLEFKSFQEKDNEDWFSELCFCILTANARAKTAIDIQDQLGFKGFSNLEKNTLANLIKVNKHRFHNNKARYIVEARKNIEIKRIIQNKRSKEARDWLVDNIKGIGYKESSHFLRNIGRTDVAILDRHIINLMIDNKILKEKPKTLNKKNYIEIENKFNKIAEKIKMSSAELDLNMWYLKTGEVLK